MRSDQISTLQDLENAYGSVSFAGVFQLKDVPATHWQSPNLDTFHPSVDNVFGEEIVKDLHSTCGILRVIS